MEANPDYVVVSLPKDQTASATPPHGQHADPDEVGAPPEPPRLKPATLAGLGLLLVAAMAGLFTVGWIPHRHKIEKIEASADRIRNAVTRVNAVRSRQAEAISVTILPGDVQALEETTVYARTTGYLKSWLVDIGDEVELGQLLAEIDTPEVDQQLHQAEAELGQLQAKLNTAKASLQLADSTYERYAQLIKSESVTPQGFDEKLADKQTAAAAVQAAAADVSAGEANVQRLTELQSFSKVYAPFGGTITRRSIELGQLVTTGAAAAQPLYRIAKTDPVRVFINVPQMYAPGVTLGLEADIIVRERPGQKFTGVVTRTARAIDPATRTLLTEIRAANPDHILLTGSYVQVKLNVNRETPPVLVPASALIVNAEGTHIATIDNNYHIHFQPVEVEGDFGADIGLSTGLPPDTLIVSNPGDRLKEGELVQVIGAKEPGKESKPDPSAVETKQAAAR
ncbi:efflux RND transporter periplasmic adaptor subunit [Planctomicrobium piriforme]|nr:efflux RND transporter periplasmic adaptor subunit [Planctomicrobium piriforme]